MNEEIAIIQKEIIRLANEGEIWMIKGKDLTVSETILINQCLKKPELQIYLLATFFSKNPL